MPYAVRQKNPMARGKVIRDGRTLKDPVRPLAHDRYTFLENLPKFEDPELEVVEISKKGDIKKLDKQLWDEREEELTLAERNREAARKKIAASYPKERAKARAKAEAKAAAEARADAEERVLAAQAEREHAEKQAVDGARRKVGEGKTAAREAKVDAEAKAEDEALAKKVNAEVKAEAKANKR